MGEWVRVGDWVSARLVVKLELVGGWLAVGCNGWLGGCLHTRGGWLAKGGWVVGCTRGVVGLLDANVDACEAAPFGVSGAVTLTLPVERELCAVFHRLYFS